MKINVTVVPHVFVVLRQKMSDTSKVLMSLKTFTFKTAASFGLKTHINLCESVALLSEEQT